MYDLTKIQTLYTPPADYDEGPPLTEEERRQWAHLRFEGIQWLKEQDFPEKEMTGFFFEMEIMEPQRFRKIMATDEPLTTLMKWIYNIE